MCRLRSRASSFSSILASGLLTVIFAAAVGCGDDDGGDDTTDDADDGDDDDGPDAAVADAAVEMTRSGLIAVTETVVTNELVLLGPAPVISGAVVSMAYIDEQTITVPPVPGFTSNIDGCFITVYDVKAEDEEPVSVDEGAFTVTGTANGDFACAFSDTAGGYVCQSTDADLGGGVPGNAIDGVLDTDGTFTLTGANFGPEMAGMYLQLDGFDGDADGVYPIVNVPKGGETLELSPLVVVPVAATGGKTATYTTFVGEGPMFDVAPVEFLDDGISKDSQDVVISKDDSDLVAGFTVTARARGQGLFLSKDLDQPHEFPATAADVTFGCVAEDCGSDPDEATGQLDAMVINGITTDVLPEKGDDGLTMLPAEFSYAVFSCSALGSDTVEIPEEGVQAILDTNPARVQITVGRFVAALPPDTTVVLGHSLTGFTTLVKP